METHTFLATVGKGVIVGAVLLGFFTAGLFIFGAWHDERSGYNSYGRVSDGVCNIAVIPVHAEITPYTYYDPEYQRIRELL